MKRIVLTDAELQARQIASRRVTVQPDDRCTLDAAGAPLDHDEKCFWCQTRPHSQYAIVNPARGKRYRLTSTQVLNHRTAPPLGAWGKICKHPPCNLQATYGAWCASHGSIEDIR